MAASSTSRSVRTPAKNGLMYKSVFSFLKIPSVVSVVEIGLFGFVVETRFNQFDAFRFPDLIRFAVVMASGMPVWTVFYTGAVHSTSPLLLISTRSDTFPLLFLSLLHFSFASPLAARRFLRKAYLVLAIPLRIYPFLCYSLHNLCQTVAFPRHSLLLHCHCSTKLVVSIAVPNPSSQLQSIAIPLRSPRFPSIAFHWISLLNHRRSDRHCSAPSAILYESLPRYSLPLPFHALLFVSVAFRVMAIQSPSVIRP